MARIQLPFKAAHWVAAAALGLIADASAAPPATAASWQLVESRGRSQTELDVASLARKDGHVSGWVQTTFNALTSSQAGAYFAYRSMKEHLRVHCSERTLTVLARAYFNDDGAEIAMIKGKGETRPVAPDTPEHRVLTRMCNPGASVTASVSAAKIDAAKRVAGAPVAPGPAALITPASTRYMDGPAISGGPSGFIKTKAESAPEHHAANTAPADAASDKLAPGPAPATAPVHPRTPHRESRQQVVARVLDERSRAPKEAYGHGSATSSAGAYEHGHWAYDGEFAPYRWGDLKPDYALCKSGTRQSPIDIRNPVVSEIEPIQFHYEDVALKVSNNGHTIQVDYPPGSFILHGGARYELVQFHFHTPSEERINGRTFDMVAHLVHKSAQGKLAVVAVLLSAGQEQALLRQVWSAMPGTANSMRERLDVTINARQLLPADPAFYSFIGSLTTPPCTEGVQWLVMKTPVEMSREQIGHFTALYPMNARPLQAQNDRLIKAGK